MVLCFQCTADTKRKIDQLLELGQYATVSELIAVAVANQLLLHEDVQPSVGSATSISAQAESQRENTEAPPPPAVPIDLALRRTNGVSALFSTRPATIGEPIAPLPTDPHVAGAETVKPSLWIFGQFNRLLPAKASCRALSNLLADGRGLDAAGVARKIAAEATELGNHLRTIDRRRNHARDDMLCTAFPGIVDPDKGRLRYANQFVASADRSGGLNGLLFDLKLINTVSPSESRISLTEAGWQFALLPSPILDSLDSQEKFSNDEREFLLEHIKRSVPRERSAFVTVLSSIEAHHDTPEAISLMMKKLEKDMNESFVSTQRSGVISRLSDLGLLSRDRDGIRVRYQLTHEGRAFLSSASMPRSVRGKQS